MACDEGLAQRIREVLDNRSGLAEKKMFGGVGFMIHGNMACGVSGDEMIVRVGPDRHKEASARAHTAGYASFLEHAGPC